MSAQSGSGPSAGRRPPASRPVVVGQTLPFTCGPAALLSVLASSGAPGRGPARELAEIDLWRESTAVACPGAHPLGLALAAERRGFRVHLAWEGGRPWLWSHIRARHALLRKGEYRRIETVWLEEAQRRGILAPSRLAPCEGDGLLLVAAGGPKGSDRSNPHWVGRWKGPRGVYLLNPLRKTPQPCVRSPEDLWRRSGFEGTRCWISLEPKRTARADRNPGAGPGSGPSNRRLPVVRKRFGRSPLANP
ncbi:MAG: peptidase C39 family protein [Thermoplasmata archaeon]